MNYDDIYILYAYWDLEVCVKERERRQVAITI